MTWAEYCEKVLTFVTTGGLTLLKVVGVFIIGYLLIRLVKVIVKKLLKRFKLSSLIQKYILNILTFVLYLGLTLIILQVIGIQITALLTTIAAAGLAVGLALQDTLKSITNGIVLIITKPFKENDFVKIDQVMGKVRSINFFTTTIETLDNRRLIIPNKNMVNFTIENNTHHLKRRFSYRFKVSHTTNTTHLEEVVKNAILSNPDVYTTPAPQLLCKEIEENGVVFEARGWCPSEMPRFEIVEAQVLQTLYNEIKKAGIELASKTIVVINDAKKDVFVDETPLPSRDLTKEPEAHHEENLSFYEMLDKKEEDAVKKLTAKRKRKTKKS